MIKGKIDKLVKHSEKTRFKTLYFFTLPILLKRHRYAV
jgi:hypothetical protein